MRFSKKIILLVGLIAVSISLISIPHTLQAANYTCYIPASGGSYQVDSPDNCKGGVVLENKSGAIVNNTDDFGCSLLGAFPNCLAGMVYWLGPGLGTLAVWIGAVFLGLIVQLSLDSTAYALQFLTEAWTVVRDIANMAFIFILIYIAFEIMLGAETSGTMRRLAWVIAIALIVNFSFFITRVVIDAGNILAVQFYNSIPVPAGTPSIGPGKAKDLSAPIMSAIGVQQLYGAQSFKQAQDAAGGAWRGLLLFSVVSIAFAAVTYVLFFIFIQVGIKFLLRIVALWFVIIASPLALVSKTLKQTESFYKTWQDYLIKFSFYPAIFLFVFLLLTTFLTQMNAGQSGNIWSILTNGYGSTINEKGEVSTGIMIAGVLIRMAFVVILLYIGLKVADWVVQEGNGLAQKFTGFVGGAMRGGVGLAFKGGAGIAAFGARQTVGRAAYSAAQSKWAKRFEATNVLGRPLRGALGAVGSAQLDIRNAPGGSILGRGVGKIAGGPISVGKPGFGKGGFAKSVETRAKNVEERAKGLKGNEVDIRKAQAEAEQKFKEEYEKKFGSGSFETNKSKNEKRRDSAREQAEKWEQEIQKARARNDQTSMEFATTQRDETRRMEKSAGDALKQFQVPADAGKKAVEQRNKELITAFAQRIGQRNIQNLGMPSRGSIEGAAKALKLVQEKSKKDKFAEAAKEYAKEVETEEGVGPEETPPTGGGAGRGTGGAGTSTATGTGTTGSGSSGGPSALNLSGATAASKALEEMHQATAALQKPQMPGSSVFADLRTASTQSSGLDSIRDELRKTREVLKKNLREIRETKMPRTPEVKIKIEQKSANDNSARVWTQPHVPPDTQASKSPTAANDNKNQKPPEAKAA